MKQKGIQIIVLFAVAAFFSNANLSAQGKYGADSAECIKYLSYYKEYYKQKAYDDATPNWRKAYQLCPATASQNLLIDGTTLLRRLITKNASNAVYKAALVDSLVALHNQRAEFYPKYAVTAYNNKGVDLSNYMKSDPQRLFDEYESIINANKEQVNVSLLLFDLQASIDLFQSNMIEADKVISTYQRNLALIDQMSPKTDADKNKNEEIKTGIGSLFAASKVASCDNLIELFSPRLASSPDDLELATNIAKIMNLTPDCTDNDLYLNAVSTMSRLNPSANSSYYLYKLYSARDNVSEARKYLEEAIAAEDSDATTDTDWTYELAVLCYKNGMIPDAYKYANSITNSEVYAGRAYFLMGNIWGSTTCGGDEISKRAPYWVACDYMNKAKNADASLAEEAGRYISQYQVYFPAAEDAFMFDITDGQSYTVACGGMRATTIVRTIK